MHADDLIMVSVDDHLVEPPSLFEGRLPAKFQDRAPSVKHLPDGRWQIPQDLIARLEDRERTYPQQRMRAL